MVELLLEIHQILVHVLAELDTQVRIVRLFLHVLVEVMGFHVKMVAQ